MNALDTILNKTDQNYVAHFHDKIIYLCCTDKIIVYLYTFLGLKYDRKLRFLFGSCI